MFDQPRLVRGFFMPAMGADPPTRHGENMHNTLPTHLLRHPVTGEPLQALGFTKRGTPIWPVMGASEPSGAPVVTPAKPAVAVPVAPAPELVPTPPTPTPPNQAPATGNGPNGFPENTPWRDMIVAQQAAYWQYNAKKWQSRAESQSDYNDLKAKAAQYDELQAASMTDHQKAVEEARAEGRTQALAEAGGTLVGEHMKAALAGLDDDRLSTLLSGLDRRQFLRADNTVDVDRVRAYASVIVPVAPVVPQVAQPAAVVPAMGAQRQAPDMGQGMPSVPKAGGLEAGRQIAQARFTRK